MIYAAAKWFEIQNVSRIEFFNVDIGSIPPITNLAYSIQLYINMYFIIFSRSFRFLLFNFVFRVIMLYTYKKDLQITF